MNFISSIVSQNEATIFVTKLKIMAYISNVMNFLCKNARLGYKTEYAMDFKNFQKMVAAVFIFIKNLNQLFKLG